MTTAVASVWYKKIFLLLAASILGLPIVLLPISLAFGGIYVLLTQYQLHHEDGKPHSFSAFQLATYTADEKLAAQLRFPVLSSCQEAETLLSSDWNRQHLSAEQLNSVIGKMCPGLDRFQSWLLHPVKWERLRNLVAAFLDLLPVSFLMLLAAALCSRVFWVGFRNG